MNKAILGLVVLVLMLGCASSGSSDQSVALSFVEELTVKNSKIELISSISTVTSIEKFIIPKDATAQIGMFFTSYHKIEEDLLLVDRHTSNLVCINNEGEVVFRILPPSPGVDRYDFIGAVDVDYLRKEIYVENRQLSKLDIFNFSGVYLRSISPPLPFMDFEVLGYNHVVYDIAQTSQEGFSDDGVVKKFLIQDKDEIFLVLPISDDFDVDAVPHNAYNRFRTVNGKLLHRMPFEGVSHLIDKDGTIQPKFKVGFSVNSQFADVGLNKAININASFIYEEQIPCPTEVIHLDEKGRSYVIYSVGNDYFFVMFREGMQETPPSHFYDINDKVYPSPRYYDNGRFYLQVNKTAYDFLQDSGAWEGLEKEAVLEALQKVTEESRDYDDIIIVSIEFK